MDALIKEIAKENEYSSGAVEQAKLLLRLLEQKKKITDIRSLYYSHGVMLEGPIVSKEHKRYNDRADGLAIVEEIIPDFWNTQLTF
jgi:hypothetical protein